MKRNKRGKKGSYREKGKETAIVKLEEIRQKGKGMNKRKKKTS